MTVYVVYRVHSKLSLVSEDTHQSSENKRRQFMLFTGCVPNCRW